jgi:hypothetical protein
LIRHYAIIDIIIDIDYYIDITLMTFAITPLRHYAAIAIDY